MKVLQITTNYPTASNPIFGIFMKEQVESLEKYGVENTIFFSNGADSKNGKIVHLLSAFKVMWKLITNHYDVVHCHSVISGLIFILSGGIFFKKCIVSFQNDPKRGFDGKYYERYCKWFNYVIVKANSRMDKPNIVYLPNGVNMDFFKPMDKETCKKKLGLDLNKRYILFVDSNTGKKRIQKRKDRFDDTMRILREKYGYADLAELIMIGISRDDVPTYMNASDLHLLCSDHEGSPNSVKECMCCNVPCVTTKVGNVTDLLDTADDCYISDNFEAEELALLVHKSLSERKPNIDLRKVIIEKELDRDSVARKLVDLYKSLL